MPDVAPLHIAMIGTRGVPARYGGFETAVEEIGQRLAARGHRVTVYCRGDQDQETHKGMHLVHLPALPVKSLETLSHTACSAVHAVAMRHRADAAVVFNAANAPLVPVLRARGIPVAVHVDGLEWKRSKWGGAGRRYYLAAERLSVRVADALIADSEGIASYYRERYGVGTELLTYGAPLQPTRTSDKLRRLDLDSGAYHLVVARFEPENHVADIVEGYVRSNAEKPLVVVGTAPYSSEYIARVHQLAAGDPRVRFTGAIWDQDLLNQLYVNALSYFHGHSVGGTNPSLLRAAGAGTPTIAFDTVFNREVLGHEGRYFTTPPDLAPLITAVESNPTPYKIAADHLRTQVATKYCWADVADGYESLLCRLASQASRPYALELGYSA